jgi:urease accessory protein
MRLVLIILLLTEALVTPAFAQVGSGQADSFAAGVIHPLNGIDHILAMCAVGLWAALVGGRAIWVWPMSFVAIMLAGFAAATFKFEISFVGPAIWSSIVALGLVVALAVKPPVWLGAATVGCFAFFHGHAHGIEVAAASRLIPYAVGFAVATACLHAVGIGIALSARGEIGKTALRGAGLFAALAGIFLMVS